MKDPLSNALESAFTYADYRKHLTQLLLDGKTTGPNQTAVYLDAARMNQSRMDRLDRKSRLSDVLSRAATALDRDLLILVITEGWCGDAAQTVPVANWLAEGSPRIDLRLVLRDEHPELMSHFLTDGASSIPVFIFLDPESLEVLGRWGPRPAPAQEIAMAQKFHPAPKPDYDTYQKVLHTWYARDKTETTQGELLPILHALPPVPDH